MASVNLSGYLNDPLSEFSDKDKILFRFASSTGTVLAGSTSVLTIDNTGYYDIDLQYGNVSIYSRNRYDNKWLLHGTYTINSDTSATSLPVLINSSTALTAAQIVEVEALVADAEAAEAAAAASQAAAETAQDEVEALFDSDYTDNVVAAIGDNAIPYADLHIPFEDGLRIQSGYGNADTITVDGTDYDLPTKSVSFARNSIAWHVNKSGVLTELAVDEPAIGENGILLHKAYTNYANFSNSLYNLGVYGATISQVTSDSPFGTDCSEFVESGDSTTNHYINFSNDVYVDSGDYFNLSIYVKASTNAGTRDFRLRSFGDFSGAGLFSVDTSGVITTVDDDCQVESIGNGWYRCSWYFEATFDGYSQGRFEMSDDDNPSYTGDGSTSFLITGAQHTVTDRVMPLAVTTSREDMIIRVTDCYLPAENNLPSTGKSFTVIFDTDARAITDTNKTIISTVNSSNSFVGIVINSTGNAVFRAGSNGGGDKNMGVITNSALYNDGDLNRYVVVYNADEGLVYGYINGDALDSSPDDVSGMTIDTSNDIDIGRTSGTWLPDASIKNLKIIHTALSENQVATLGSAS